jgi:hypothetical protein
MDIFYAVKQLAHEINILQAQIGEKTTALRKLWPTLSHQEQLLIDSPSIPPEPAPSEGQPTAPDKPKPKKSG